MHLHIYEYYTLKVKNHFFYCLSVYIQSPRWHKYQIN